MEKVSVILYVTSLGYSHYQLKIKFREIFPENVQSANNIDNSLITLYFDYEDRYIKKTGWEKVSEILYVTSLGYSHYQLKIKFREIFPENVQSATNISNSLITLYFDHADRYIKKTGWKKSL